MTAPDTKAIRAQMVEEEKDKACRLLISGFMLDCNAIGYIAAAENLVRGIKEYAALAACKGVRDE